MIDGRRYGSAASIVVTGVILFVPNVLALGRGTTLAGSAIAGVGTVLSIVLMGASVLLARSEISTGYVQRVAGWNLLGFVVLGSVLLLGRSVVVGDVPTYVVATVLAVSAFAHLVIGVNDVRRIRARDLAREREKLAVVNRLLRHNLRHESQILIGYADAIEDDAARKRVVDVGERLSSMNERAGRVQGLLDDAVTADESVDLSAVVTRVVDRLEREHPDARFDVSIGEESAVRGDERLEQVVHELVENAVVHADDDPTVTIDATSDGDRVELVISDDGPGIPELERAVVGRETPITQLSHSKGFGLWVSKWLTEAAGGDLAFDGDEGNAVVVRLPQASN